ncbi:MAG: ABC transporter substrate-binding protein [Candidatus Binatia bacterium]|jgi:NitT/TauT family transport system substrate-binding protein
MKTKIFALLLATLHFGFAGRFVSAQEIYMSYPGLTGESSPLWVAREAGIFKEYGIESKLIYMEGGRLSIQSLLSATTQFMTGDAVSALTAVAGGADIVLLASAKNVLPYVFAVSKDVRRNEDLKGKIIATSQVGGRAGEIARMAVKNMGLDADKDVTYLAVGGTMSRLAALSTGRVQAAPISHIMVPVAEERGLRVMHLEPIPLIIDALWTTRKYAEENPQVLNNVLRAYVRGIATLVREREKSMDIMRKYMRVSDTRVIQNAYDGYRKDVDRVPIPSDKAIQTTLEITYRLAPKLAGIDIKKHLYFGPVQRLKEEGFIDRLYK